MVLDIFSWVAVAALSASFWFQIWKIHVHREVRDLSITYYVLLTVGYAILTVTAFKESSLIFIVKQIATLIPSVIIIIQILIHRGDQWSDS